MLWTDLDSAEWEPMVQDFESTCFRWEQQPVYTSDLATGWPDRWRSGDLTPPGGTTDFAARVIGPIAASGRTRSRVRLFDDDDHRWAWYQDWIDWVSDILRAAGETIHRMPRQVAVELDLVGDPLVDWWLVDNRFVLWQRYTAEGDFAGVDLDDSPEALAYCRRVWSVVSQQVTAAG